MYIYLNKYNYKEKIEKLRDIDGFVLSYFLRKKESFEEITYIFNKEYLLKEIEHWIELNAIEFRVKVLLNEYKN
jgi:hypothetical protein